MPPRRIAVTSATRHVPTLVGVIVTAPSTSAEPAFAAIPIRSGRASSVTVPVATTR
jgi:hypothetical protein